MVGASYVWPLPGGHVYYVSTGSIFVEHKGNINVAISAIVDEKGNSLVDIYESLDSVVYMAELSILYRAIEQAKVDVTVFTSTPVLAKHLNGDSLPQKIDAIKLHNRIEAWQDEYDFIVRAEWIKSSKNDAQILVRRLKEGYIEKEFTTST